MKKIGKADKLELVNSKSDPAKCKVAFKFGGAVDANFVPRSQLQQVEGICSKRLEVM